jgi:hypothetical protein
MTALKIANYDQIVDGNVYLGDLSIDQSISYSRSIAFWPQGGQGGSLSTGTINIDNRNGRYDYLITESVRDKIVQVTRNGDALLTGVIEDVSARDDFTVSFRLGDVLSRLDKPLQRLVYGNEADENVRDSILPICLGIARNIRPTLYDAVDASLGPAYRVHDFSLSGVINVRDSGIELTQTGWEFDTRIANAGIVIDVEPAGVLTCDASSSGQAQYSTSDDLSGDGTFASFTGSSGYRSTSASPFPSSDLPDGWGRARTPGAGDDGALGDPYSISFDGGLKMTNPESTAAFHWLYTADGSSPEGVISTPFVSGKVYRLQFEVVSLIGGGILNDRGRLRMRLSGSERVIFEIDANRGQIDGESFVSDFVVSESTDQGLIIALEGYGPEVVIQNLKAFEADAPSKTTLTGITLSNYVKEVVFRASESVQNINNSDITAIAGTSQAPLGYYTESPVTALSVMRRALDSYTADVFSDREGNIRFAQLRDPAETTTSFLIDRDRMIGTPRVTVDNAPGLSTSALARRNNYQFRDGDFADNLSAIPLELRQAYTQRAQFTAQAVIPEGFPTIYAHAVDAEPLDTVYDLKFDAQNEIQRVINLYSQPRFLVDVEIALDQDEFVELNDIVLLQYPRYGFNDGVNFLVVGVDDVVVAKEGRRTARLRLWGSTGKNFTPATPPVPPVAQLFLATEGLIDIVTESNEVIEVES